MDLSFSRLPHPAADAAPAVDAAALLAALGACRCTMQAIDRHLFAPADGAFNGRVARLLTGWQG